MILETKWKGFIIEWKILGYSIRREFDGYKYPILFSTISQAISKINKIVEP